MRVLILAAAAAVVLSGCAPVAIVYDASRKGSVSVAERIFAQTHPDVASDAAAECVIQAMTYGEIVKLGTSDTTVVTAKSRDLMAEVVKRPKAAECLAALPKTPA